MKRIALAASLLLVAAAIAGVARPEGAHAVDGTTATPDDSITVAGNGSVSGVPTSASFSFGVDVRAASAKAAIAANAREMRQVIAGVQSAGAATSGRSRSRSPRSSRTMVSRRASRPRMS